MGKKKGNKKVDDDDWEAEFAAAQAAVEGSDEPKVEEDVKTPATDGDDQKEESKVAEDTAPKEEEADPNRILTKKEKEKIKKDKEKQKKKEKAKRAKEQAASADIEGSDEPKVEEDVKTPATDGDDQKEESKVAEDTAPKEEEADPNRILTKKEKEKIKKDKEKQKKKEKAKRAKEQAASADIEGSDEPKVEEDVKTPATDGDDQKEEPKVAEDTAPKEEEEADPNRILTKKEKEKIKKDKKKKKAAGAQEEKPKKLTAMGAMLKEKLRLEKIAKDKMEAEVAEKQRLIDEEEAEKQRVIDDEKRKKEEKKEREKAKIAKQKAEGTYMTKAQKKKQAEKEAALARMQNMMGLDVPSKPESGGDGGDRKPKKAVYSKKKKVVKKTDEEIAADKAKKEAEEKAADEEAKKKKKKEVVEDWMALSSEEEEEEEEAKVQSKEEEVKAEEVPQSAAKGKKKAVVEEEEPVKDNSNAAEDYGGVDVGRMRSPIVTVLGHVDTGKTKILDKIRRSSVQLGEAGGITQQIGASFFPVKEVQRQTEKVKAAIGFDWDVPGLLIMDTPGHESFSNLRDRGSSLCNIAILVVDIMHGIENQTLESINLLKQKKCPFIVALNKVDVLNQWKPSLNSPIQNSLKKQHEATKDQFDVLCGRALLGLRENGLNCELYWNNKNDREYINVVPTSAHTGEGIPDLLFLLIKLSQTMLKKQITYTGDLRCTVLEVKKIPGYGTTIDVILADGELKEGDQVVMAGIEGPIVTSIRSLLMPEPLKELRVKNAYRQFKSVPAANGIKISGRDLDNAIPGLKLYVGNTEEEVERLKELVVKEKAASINSLTHKNSHKGVHVQASTIGSMEALLSFLKDMKIPVSGVSIGPVTKKDVTRASVQLERDPRLALILAFDVTVEREAQQHAASLGIKIFEAMIIYNLFDMFTKHVEDEKARLKLQFSTVAVFPCVLRIMPDNVFNSRDPIVMGVVVEKGQLRVGARLTADKPPEFCDLGVVTSLEFDNKPIEVANIGQEVCVKIESAGGDKKLFGRHFDEKDKIISKISRQSIDALKTYFKDDLKKADIILLKKMKEKFDIM